MIFRLTSKEGSLRHAYFQLLFIAVKAGAARALVSWKQFMNIIKTLLAVCQTTCNDMCLVECDMPSLKALVRQRQHKYITEKLRIWQDDSPPNFALNLVESANTVSYRIIN